MYEEYCIERKISISREKLKCNTCMGRPRKCRTCDEKKKIYDYDSDECERSHSKCKECKAKPRQPKAKAKQPRQVKKKMCNRCPGKQCKSQDKFRPEEWEKVRLVRDDRRCKTCDKRFTRKRKTPSSDLTSDD